MPLNFKYLSPVKVSLKELRTRNMTGLNLKYNLIDLDEIRLAQFSVGCAHIQVK